MKALGKIKLVRDSVCKIYSAERWRNLSLGVKNHSCYELAGFLSLLYTKSNFWDWSVCLLGEVFTGCVMLCRTVDAQIPGVNVLRKSNAEGCVPLWSKMLSIRPLLENIIRRIFGRGNAKFLVERVEYLWQIWIRNFLWRDYKNNCSSQVNNVSNLTTFCHHVNSDFHRLWWMQEQKAKITLKACKHGGSLREELDWGNELNPWS